LTSGVHADTKSEPEKPLTKQQIALANFKKSIDSKKALAGAGIGGSAAAKEKKVNPTIELMKLKQRAKGADPRKKDGDVPMLERWYLTVKFVEGETRKEVATKDVWVQKVRARVFVSEMLFELPIRYS
jgi:hypothetical protein